MPSKPPKLKQVEIAQYGDAMRALGIAADAIASAQAFTRDIRTSADEQVAGFRIKMQQHLDRRDFRPRVVFRPHAKNIWTVSFNSEVYRFGPLDPLPNDEDEMPYWWLEPDGSRHPCRSAFMCLLAIVSHYCNTEEDDTPSPELPIPATGPVAQEKDIPDA